MMKMCIFIFILGVIAIATGARHLVRQTVEITGYGINVQKGSKTLFANWSDVTELKGYRAIGYYRTSNTVPVVSIRTKDWEFTIIYWKFGKDELKQAFEFMARWGLYYKVKVVDEIGWLPEDIMPKEAQFVVKMKGYAVLAKVGFYMIVAGIPLVMLGFIWGPAVMIGVILFFIGGMCVMGGLVGLDDEKRKMAKELNGSSDPRKH